MTRVRTQKIDFSSGPVWKCIMAFTVLFGMGGVPLFPWSGGEYYFRPDIHFWIAYGDFRCSIGDDYQPGKGVTKDIFRLGTWNFIMQGTNCLVQIVCNATLQNYGGDVYVGIMTVANSVREIFMLPVSGIENIFLWFCIHGISICRTIHVSGIGRCEACDFLLLAS